MSVHVLRNLRGVRTFQNFYIQKITYFILVKVKQSLIYLPIHSIIINQLHLYKIFQSWDFISKDIINNTSRKVNPITK